MSMKYLLTFLLNAISLSIFCQNSPAGIWKTVDDQSGKEKSYVEIYMKNDSYFAKVVKLLPGATTQICNDCPGDKKGKNLVGLDIMWNMSKYKNYWSNGQIVDPKNGKVYSCSMWLKSPDELEVRGYFGISLLGRTQSWYRVK